MLEDLGFIVRGYGSIGANLRENIQNEIGCIIAKRSSRYLTPAHYYYIALRLFVFMVYSRAILFPSSL